MELAVLDWVLLSVMAIFTVMGLFQGFSGQLGSIVGLAAALATGYFAFSPLLELVDECDCVSGEVSQKGLAAFIDFVVCLVVFGLLRRMVAKFVSFLVPQPMNAILGAVAGVLKGAVAIGLLTGFGIVQTGRFSEGVFASNSSIVKAVGEVADMYVQGAESD